MLSIIQPVRTGALAFALLVQMLPGTALAQQKSDENAVTSSDDAFGNSVGLERTGIYSQFSTRGFSPLDAGNARLDGIYYDPVSLVTLRVRSSQAIRVGYAALEYPFAAPTGIVDNQLRTAGDEPNVGLELHRQQYGSYVAILDAQIPLMKDRLALAAGVSHGHGKFIDGASQDNYSIALKPVIRFDGVEISPFYSVNYVRNSLTRALVRIGGDFVPDVPKAKRFFGSPWAQNSLNNVNYGMTVKARLTDRLSLRGGIFNSALRRNANFTELFEVFDKDQTARHFLIADPVQDLHSWSGEVQLGYRLNKGKWQHRFIAGYRARDRYTEFGGSDVFNFDFRTVRLGEQDGGSEPDYIFKPVNRGKVKQSSLMLGYLGKIEGIGQVNLGLQRASFRGQSISGAMTTGTREKHWLYNASLGIDITPDLMIYGGTQRGLEDNGAASQSAENRNEQLRPTLSTQYEAGLRWKFGKDVLLIGIFEISKPNFSLDGANFFTELGVERHRGIEASYSGHFMADRLSLLVGAMVMDPVVSGAGRDLGLLGRFPVGVRGTRARLDTNYRTDWLGGLTPTLSIVYRGSTAAVSKPISDDDDRQLEIRSRTTVDIGFRLPFDAGPYSATLRGKIENLFNQKRWLAPASGTLFMADQRYASLSLLVDF